MLIGNPHDEVYYGREKNTGLNELSKDIHQNAIDHGWWEDEREFGTIIALCHSELSEALEEYRRGKPDMYFVRETSPMPNYQSCEVDETDFSKRRWEKPEGIGIELADCIIRILDYCGHANIDIEKAIEIKHQYNKTREYRHGGKRI